jgi:hypothetical protein
MCFMLQFPIYARYSFDMVQNCSWFFMNLGFSNFFEFPIFSISIRGVICDFVELLIAGSNAPHTVKFGKLQHPLAVVHFFPQNCFNGKSLLPVTIMEGSHCFMTPRNVNVYRARYCLMVGRGGEIFLKFEIKF